MSLRRFLPRFVPLVVLLLGGVSFPARAVPRVAVWDPEKPAGHPRVRLFEEHLDRAVESLRRSGAEVVRLTAEQLADGTRFAAARFDLVVFPGEVVPGMAIPALRAFAEEGGVVMNLGGKIPFLNRLARRADGTWTVSPEAPGFAWQTDEVLRLFGVRYVYSPPHHDLARRFTATPLLRRYLPGAGEVVPVSFLENWWIPAPSVGDVAGEYFPLIRSQRADGVDVTPQLAIVRAGHRHGILCLNPLFTVGTQPVVWPHADALLAALAAMACDLRSGALELTPAMRADVRADVPPLRIEPDTPGAVPERAATETIIQFGRFNDSGFDLDAGPLPAVLAPGGTVTLALPPLPGEPLFLRVRGAYAANGAALRAEIGGRTVLHESFLLPDASGAGNPTAGAYDGLAAPLLRLVFVPPAAGADRLTFGNTGTAPFHFDAVRLERRTAPPPRRWIGQYAGFRSSMPDGVNTIPAGITRRWSVLRCDLRGQFAGPPGDPARWDALRRHLDKFAAMNPRWNLVLMGTPEWAAISPERYAQGRREGRPHCVPPDTAKYAGIVEWVVANYGQNVEVYEIWNEADTFQFWRGTTEEYLAFAEAVFTLLRRIAPGKDVILAGPAGIVGRSYLNAVLPSGISRRTSFVPLHPYAGQSVGWDIPHGLLQGMLFALGLDQEIYCNESGFVWKPGEWFRDPSWSPQRQERALSAAMGRLLATDLAKLTLFLAGGDEHHFGVYDAEGRPRPAAAVIEDYLTLALDDGRRAAIALASRDGAALEGVYAAAASHADGSLTIVVNPAEAAALQPPPDSAFATAERDEWTTFWGKSEWREGTVRIMPDAGRDYCGFYRRTLLNPALHPEVEVTVAEAAGRWTLQLKFGDGDDPLVFAEEGAGTFRAEYASRLRNRAPRPVEISFRATRPLTLDSIRFPAAPRPLGVRLAFPLPGDGDWQATATKTGQDVPVRLDLHGTGAQRWAEASLDLTGRTVVRVGRATSATGR